MPAEPCATVPHSPAASLLNDRGDRRRSERSRARPSYDVLLGHKRGGRPIHPTEEDFRQNLRFRVTLRRFLRWSEEQAAEAGLTPAQHQLLVAIKGHPGPQAPAVREIADYLLLQSHSAVGLVDRAEAAGVVRRTPDPEDARVVRVELTEQGDKLVTKLTTAHLAKLYELAATLSHVAPRGEHANASAGSGDHGGLLSDLDAGR